MMQGATVTMCVVRSTMEPWMDQHYQLRNYALPHKLSKPSFLLTLDIHSVISVHFAFFITEAIMPVTPVPHDKNKTAQYDVGS